MSEIDRINNDLVVDDMVYRPVSTLPNQNIEGHLCINYNGKVLEFKDKDCASYVKTLRKLLKECRENIASIDYDSPVLDREQSILLNKIDQVLQEKE